MEPFITVEQVRMVYRGARGGTVEAIAAADLTVDEGEFVCLIGPSGCGKSTLLNIIGGMRTPTSGRVLIDGAPVTEPQPEKAAFVFQDYSLFPWRNVVANVEIGLQIRGVGKEQRRAAADRYLELVGLSAFADAYPAELSGGMQQRVALARALTLETDILLMDEPFGALDEQTRMVLGDEISRIVSETKKTTMFVTHSLAEAVYLADRVVVMSSRPGRIKTILTVQEQRPRLPSFMTSDTFTALRNELFELLHDEFVMAAQADMEAQLSR